MDTDRRSGPPPTERASADDPAGRITGAVAVDAFLALVIGAAVVASPSLVTGQRMSVASVVLGIVIAAALFVRRGRALPVLAVVTVAASACVALGEHPVPAALAVGLALLTVARRTEWWAALSAGAVALLVVLVPCVVRTVGNPRAYGEVWGMSALIGAILLLPGTVAVAVRLRRRSVERAGAEEIRRRVAEERLGIAREVHDVVGHALAVISMQSGVALHVSEKRPEQMVAALEAVSQVSREAMAELDRTFGVFRETPDDSGHGLHRLDELVATMGRAGVEVTLRVRGERVALRPEVERAAYRIVQESLTNVLHHAEDNAASVEVGYEPQALLVRVANEGRPNGGSSRPRGPRPRSDGGHGIQGMKDRTEALGGLLEAGPREGGGFVVTARLPRAHYAP
ncbi:sensor histidine kinase [Streptomyces sp. NPDC052051]|uniref:sensor histidine kinase n=1 Tax=Streptomyces sp. NPDC052051 TaxID=3154649 RepID=UPI0034132F37